MIDELKNAIIEQNQKKAKEITENLIKSGIDINEIINAITNGLRIVGELFEKGELFLPEVIRAANTAKTSLNLILPKILEKKSNSNNGTIAIGSLGPHDIGKTLVSAALIANGFKVIDMGININLNIVEKTLKENDIDILALSIMLTSDIEKAKIIIERVRKLFKELKIIVGGAVINENIAKEIKADAYGKDEKEAVEIVKKLLGGK
ncbi:MAG: cobalamin-dependent protein [Candidatus Methanomethylicaceae archaeon]